MPCAASRVGCSTSIFRCPIISVAERVSVSFRTPGQPDPGYIGLQARTPNRFPMPTEVYPTICHDWLPELRIAPFEQGRADIECFLVETRVSAFLVNQKMRCLLEALVEHSSMAALRTQCLEASLGTSIDEAEVSAAIASDSPKAVFQETVRPRPGKRLFIFPSACCRPASVQAAGLTRLRGLYSPAVVAVVTAGFLLLGCHGCWRGGSGNASTPGLSSHRCPAGCSAGTCLIALIHELGHAAACVWFGLPPGEIGFGLYLLFPVFYTDVTKAWRLRSSRRAVVDAGGIYFQMILVALAVPLAHHLGNDRRIFAFVLYNLYLIFHNLNPLFKMDGYWIFSDLAGSAGTSSRQRTWQIFRQGVLSGPIANRPRGFPWMEKKKDLAAAPMPMRSRCWPMGVVCRRRLALQWFAAQLKPYSAAVAAAHLRAIAAGRAGWRTMHPSREKNAAEARAGQPDARLDSWIPLISWAVA